MSQRVRESESQRVRECNLDPDAFSQSVTECTLDPEALNEAVWQGDEVVNNRKVSVFAVGYEDGSFSVFATEKSAADAADAGIPTRHSNPF